MMDNEHAKKKINLYFSKLEKGDAVWIDGWKEITKGSLKPGVYVDIYKAFDNGARLTTLEHYIPQEGEKVICLGCSFKFTFGKVYIVRKTEEVPEPHVLNDNGNITRLSSYHFKTLHCWGVIPRYEQVKNKEKTTVTEKLNEVVKNKMNKEKEDDKMSEIKAIEGSKYTGKFKVGDEVKVIGIVSGADNVRVKRRINEVGIIARVDKDMTRFNYVVSFNDDKHPFNEAELELVSKHDEDRPASSHYHIDNNGNDVWQFVDDNLSDERVKGFHQINAIKYVSRYNKKHDTKEKRIEDLEKAKVSIDKLIELEEIK